jgi:peptidoglycan hydrolase-like protein with peptidoglycan-binding domain
MKRLIVLAAATLAAGCASQPSSQTPAYSGSSYQPPVQASRPAPAPTPQPSAAVRDAQERLGRLGFYHGPIDGLAGGETEHAIESFQASRGLASTGTLNPATLQAMKTSEARAAPAALDTTNVRALQNRLHQLGFYGGPADGVWGSTTQSALERFQKSRGLEVTGTLNRVTANALGVESMPAAQQANLGQPLDPAVARNIQHRLGQLGFYNGRADGVMGPATKQALEHFQETRALAVTGDLNPTTIAALGLDPNNLAAGVPPGGGYGSSTRR